MLDIFYKGSAWLMCRQWSVASLHSELHMTCILSVRKSAFVQRGTDSMNLAVLTQACRLCGPFARKSAKPQLESRLMLPWCGAFPYYLTFEVETPLSMTRMLLRMLPASQQRALRGLPSYQRQSTVKVHFPTVR